MENLLFIGFIFGLRHALESDHFTAIASLSTESKGIGHSIKMGAVWGLGHTITLLIVGGTVLMMDSVVPENVSVALEWLVGLMLIGLGFDVIRRIIKSKVHFHSHTHKDGEKHFHAHTHKSETDSYDVNSHDHRHFRDFPVRAFVVGLIHGLAGSAALIILTINATHSFWLGIAYIMIFGLGSIIGMAALSLVIAIPLNKYKNINKTYNYLSICVGIFTVIIGLVLVVENSELVLGFI